MTVEIPSEFSAFVYEAMQSGSFASEADVVAAGLRLLREQDEKRHALRQDIQVGIDSLDRGEGIPSDEVFADLRQRADGFAS